MPALPDKEIDDIEENTGHLIVNANDENVKRRAQRGYQEEGLKGIRSFGYLIINEFKRMEDGCKSRSKAVLCRMYGPFTAGQKDYSEEPAVLELPPCETINRRTGTALP